MSDLKQLRQSQTVGLLEANIIPVVQEQHLLICSLPICNAAAMEVTRNKKDGLIHDETTVRAGALELTQKIAKDAMAPITHTLDIDAQPFVLALGHTGLNLPFKIGVLLNLMLALSYAVTQQTSRDIRGNQSTNKYEGTHPHEHIFET